MKRGKVYSAFACLAVLAAAGTALADVDGFETLSDWNALPLAKTGVQAGLASSVSPSGNTLLDYNNFIGTDPNTGLKILAEINGPGEITRMWMPHATANAAQTFQVYLNVPLSGTGSATPVINTDTATLLPAQAYGNGAQFRSPLVQTMLGGSVSYEPITFAQSAIVEMGGGNPTPVFYQVNYHTFAAGTSVTNFTLGSAPASRATTVSALSSLGSNPGPTPSNSAATGSISVPAGQTDTLANLTGGGQIGALTLSMGSSPTDAQLDGLRLRITYDGSSAPAVDVPVSQFFGVGHGRHDYTSLPMGASSGNYYCYFPMPFRGGASVQLYNSTGAAIPVNSATVQYTPGTPTPTANYFHAVYQSQVTNSSNATYNMLHVTGSGQYVGNILSISGGNIYQNLEGNDIVTVDGSTVLEGTGGEDAYNGGYYYNNAASGTTTTDHGDLANQSSGSSSFSGLLNYPGNSADQYRWLISDNVPFTQSLDVAMQNNDSTDNVNWGSTAFYYSTTPAPEPSAAVFMFLAAAGALLLRRRRSSLN